MAGFFFYGTLCHLPLLEVVVGRRVRAEPALLPGHSVFWVRGETYPLLKEGGPGARGLYVGDLTAEEVARLDWYEGAYAVATGFVRLTDDGQEVEAAMFMPPDGLAAGEPWEHADWAARWGDTVTAAAADLMRHFGRDGAGPHLTRYPQMLVRGASRVRAEKDRPTTLRFRAGPGDVVELGMRMPYAEYFAVEEFDLRFRRFDGGMSRPVRRAVFVSGDASVVLPYDPAHDRVMVIEQFRAGPHARGDAQPWLIEAIAGRVDAGETPADAAIREAREEAGIEFRALLPALSYYPSPGAKSEYLYTFVGIADLPAEGSWTGGAADEDEDIRAHVITFDRLMDLVATGEADNAPLIALALWLDRRRDELRRAAR